MAFSDIGIANKKIAVKMSKNEGKRTENQINS